MSAAKRIDMGVPLLFNIMVHDVESCVQGKVVLTMYADDLAGHPRQKTPQRE